MSGTRRKPGRMHAHVEGFQARLLELGYTPGTVRDMLKTVGRLGRWMASTDVEPSQLDEASIDAFRAALRAGGTRRVPGRRAFRPLLDYLTDQGVVPIEVVASTPVEELLTDYRAWLIVERGLAAATVLRYEKLARRFLNERAAEDGSGFVADLTAAHVTAFLLHESARVSVGAAKGRVAELRSLLRFVYLEGMTPVALATAVPPVAGWHETRVPAGVAAADVTRLLDSCDRTAAVGIRDFAMLVVVARLGLRSAEVAGLELDDVDWRAGEIAVRGKGRRSDRLPLPGDVGEALSAYVCQARPATSIRKVFLTHKAPRRAIRPDLVSDATRRACDRAGVPRVGAHRLRHALATDLLQRGATLVEVSQVLRHRDLATTAVYAKVDLATLRGLAQPWPGAQQ